jgi:hypothetical protein
LYLRLSEPGNVAAPAAPDFTNAGFVAALLDCALIANSLLLFSLATNFERRHRTAGVNLSK